MSHYNDPEFFPNLRAAKLESFAHTWAKYFTFVKRISLYQVPVDGFDYSVKYVMHFEISDISKTEGYGELGGYREDNKSLFEALIEADKSWIETLEGPNGLLSALATSENAFKEVYKHDPKDNFIDEWRFVTKLPEGIVEKYSWVLFSHTDNEKQSSPDIASVIEATDYSIKDKKNVFKRVGKNWFFKYKDEIATLPDHYKIRYIVHLLENTKVKIHSSDLINDVKNENIIVKIEEQSDAIKSAKSEWQGLTEKQLGNKGVDLTKLEIDELTKAQKDRFEDEGYKILQRLNDAKKNKNQPIIDQAEKELRSYKRSVVSG